LPLLSSERSVFDIEHPLQSVSKMGGALKRLAAAVPWEKIRVLLALNVQSTVTIKTSPGQPRSLASSAEKPVNTSER
jgi:hypothetical protein